MKKSEKRRILLLIIAVIVIIAILVKVRNGIQTNNGSNGSNVSVNNNNGTQSSDEKNVSIREDGSKVNTSRKIAEVKNVGDLEISNIELTAKDGQSTILADVKNNGSAKTEVTLLDIIVMGEDGNEIMTIGGIIGEIESGGTTQLNASATSDFANAEDLVIKLSDSQSINSATEIDAGAEMQLTE